MPNKPTARKAPRVSFGTRGTGTTPVNPSDSSASSSTANVFDDIGPNQPVDIPDSGVVTVVPFGDVESETVGGGGIRKSSRIKKRASGGAIKSASSRADGCAMRGKTKGRII
jgi:hypothetical protein